MKYEIRENEYYREIIKGQEVCGNCNYFRYHYLLIEEPVIGGPHIKQAHFGHCVEGRIKNRRVDQSCEKFARG